MNLDIFAQFIKGAGRRGMLSPGNTGRLAWLCVAASLFCSAAGGQGLLEGGGGSLPADAPPVEASDGEVAYHLVEGWVRSGRVPADDALPIAPLRGVLGVVVTLRDNGRQVGRATVLRPDLADTVDALGPTVDVASLLAEATRNALAETERFQNRRAVELNITDPALVADSLRELHARLMIDVQIGHGLSTVTLAPNGPADGVYAQFVPGYHGLRMTGPLMPQGDLIWPGNALAANTSPRSQLVQLLDRQGFEQGDLELVARPSGPQLERFDVIHFIQAGPDQPPRQLIRGNVVVPRRALDTRGLDGIAERIARHLDGKIEVLNDGTQVLRGPYRPSYNRIEPELAEVRQASLACFAMMAQSRAAQQRIPGERISRVRAARVLKVVETLIPVADPPGAAIQPVSVALLLLALAESPVPVDTEARDALGEALLALRLEGGGYKRGGYSDAQDADERVGRATEAVITAALASWYASQEAPDPAIAAGVWQSMNELVQANRDDEQGARLADLTWLSIAYSRAGRVIAGAVDDDQAQAKLAEMQAFFAEQLQMLMDQQVQGVPLLGPDDIAGAYVTQNGPLGAAPDPTWESAMPLAILSIGLRDEPIVPADEIFGPLLSAQLGARFIAQLLITNQNAYYVRDRLAASGGVRRSLWDNTLSLDCSSMALIALSELQASLNILEQRDLPE